ncbi:MAG: hypothetical protein IPJ20_01190 [Flammeovirgaceae bacterium]|jgi:hypothetical protein|nr:hypothetical protein [Flammeovirgaceae bacterium]
MKICDQYNHHNGFERIQREDGLYRELEEILTEPNLRFGSNSPREIKRKISDRFNQKGWADKVKVGNSNLTISFLKFKIGICFQIGNVARTYADILKLCQLNKMGVIDAGIIVVPHKLESNKMGTNYAQFDRLASELFQFKDIVSTPILVLGLSN